MDPALVQQFWNEARLQLLSFRANQPASTEMLKARLEEGARRIDSNRRTSLYNLPSLYQVRFNEIIGDALYVANKWLKDGKPQVPTV